MDRYYDEKSGELKDEYICLRCGKPFHEHEDKSYDEDVLCDDCLKKDE